MFNSYYSLDTVVRNLLEFPVIRALIDGNLLLVSTGISMEHLPPSKQTNARALNTQIFSSVMGLMLNLCEKEEKRGMNKEIGKKNI